MRYGRAQPPRAAARTRWWRELTWLPRYGENGSRTMANSTENQWANSGLDLLVELGGDRAAGGLRSRLEESLRDAVRSGRLPLGTRLPPTRALARDLGISRG